MPTLFSLNLGIQTLFEMLAFASMYMHTHISPVAHIMFAQKQSKHT